MVLKPIFTYLQLYQFYYNNQMNQLTIRLISNKIQISGSIFYINGDLMDRLIFM